MTNKSLESITISQQQRHTEEIEDIIFTPPKWLLRWGIALFFTILIFLFSLSIFIRYPDIIKTQLKIRLITPPIPVTSNISGNLIRLQVEENQYVSKGQSLAYIESSSNHDQVLNILNNLQVLQEYLFSEEKKINYYFSGPNDLQIGDLQNSYQIFFSKYLEYRLSPSTSQRVGLLEAMNNLMSEATIWERNYVLRAPKDGKISFAGTIQENQNLKPGQDIFYISSGKAGFTGEMILPQFNLGKIKEGQEVLIKLQSYPSEEYGVLTGRIGKISNLPYRDSIFLARVDISKNQLDPESTKIRLKSGMKASAEIITQDASLLTRFCKSIKMLSNSVN